MDMSLIAKALQRGGGLVPTLGIELVEDDSGSPGCRMPIRQELTGSPGIAHGGAVAALLDTALGALAIQRALRRGRVPATVELKTNFLRPVRRGEVLFTRTQLESEGKSLLVISGRAFAEGDDEPVAFAVGTFNLYDSPQMLEGLARLGEDA